MSSAQVVPQSFTSSEDVEAPRGTAQKGGNKRDLSLPYLALIPQSSTSNSTWGECAFRSILIQAPSTSCFDADAPGKSNGRGMKGCKTGEMQCLRPRGFQVSLLHKNVEASGLLEA